MFLTRARRLAIALSLALASAAALVGPAAADDPASASCSPSSGTLAVGAGVSCTFTPGTGTTFLFWSAPGFTPQSSSGTSAAFTAARGGSGSITAYWSAPGLGAVSQTFSYTIAAAAPSATVSCSPSGGTIGLGSPVSCSFSGSGGARFLFWSAPGFAPQSSSDTNATFAAARLGSGSITAHYSIPGQGGLAQTFTYTIGGA